MKKTRRFKRSRSVSDIALNISRIPLMKLHVSSESACTLGVELSAAGGTRIESVSENTSGSDAIVFFLLLSNSDTGDLSLTTNVNVFTFVAFNCLHMKMQQERKVLSSSFRENPAVCPEA
jgi:hypothetical protein